jgi:hypothetical protein
MIIDLSYLDHDRMVQENGAQQRQNRVPLVLSSVLHRLLMQTGTKRFFDDFDRDGRRGGIAWNKWWAL